MLTTSFRGHAAAALFLFLVCAPALAAEEWSRFRGPNGSGISDGSAIPSTFEGEGALLWSAEVPFGRFVAGDRR